MSTTVMRPPKQRRGNSLQDLVFRLIVYLMLATVVVVMLFPYLYILSTSFKETYTLVSIPPKLIPDPISFENYQYIVAKLPFVRWFTNSLIVAALSTVGTLLIDALAAYAFARKEFFGRDTLFALLLATVMIPGSLLLIPTFLITNTLGMVDTYAGLIIPGLGGVVGIFLLRQFILTLPLELEDAARIDGCTEFGVFWRIVMPLLKPALGMLAILTFTGQWNSLIWPLVITNDKSRYTLSLGLALLRGEFQVNYGITSAAAFISVLPLLILFLFLQRYFMEGLTAGAVKG